MKNLKLIPFLFFPFVCLGQDFKVVYNQAVEAYKGVYIYQKDSFPPVFEKLQNAMNIKDTNDVYFMLYDLNYKLVTANQYSKEEAKQILQQAKDYLMKYEARAKVDFANDAREMYKMQLTMEKSLKKISNREKVMGDRR